MKRLKLIASSLVVASVLALNPMEASAEWKQDSNGWWNTEGSSYSVGWRQIDEKWYYFGQDGYMATGWIYYDKKWYYLNYAGNMRCGWLLYKEDKYYYFNEDGTMRTSTITIDGNIYNFNEDGSLNLG